MPAIEFLNEKESLVPADIDAVEAELGFRFPEQFRNHYLAHNGGMPMPNCLKRNGEYWSVNEIYSIKYGKKGGSLERCYNMVVVGGEDYFPRGLVPFAQDGGGDLYCFRVDGPREGSICCWQHEYPDHPERATVDLADDLDSFLAALVMPPD